MSSTAAHEEQTEGRRRLVTNVASLDSLVGAHPGALEEIYRGGTALDPQLLGDAPKGRLLAMVPGSNAFLLTRPFMRMLANDLFPWRGKTFDHGGNSGTNRIYGAHLFRFQVKSAPSRVDDKPTLELDYSPASYKNPWPVNAIKDELRLVGDGIAIGPAYIAGAQFLWFGLER